MAVVKALVFYDDTKRVEQVRATDSVAPAGSGITRSITNISANTTAGATVATDYVYFCSGTITLTLPTAVGNTNCYTLKNVGSGTISIATTASQTIDASTVPIIIVSKDSPSIDLISNGSNWFII